MGIQGSIRDYLQYCEYRKELDEKTLKAYRIDLRQYFDFFNNYDPQKEEIEKYIISLHKKYKQKTVKRKIASVKAFYNYLEEQEIIFESPFRRINVKFKEAFVLPRIISRKDIEQLLNHMYECAEMANGKKYRYCLRDITIVECLFATGARVYEISNLKEECVDLASGLIRISGKGNKERYIQVSDLNILSLMKKYYDQNKAEIKRCGYFFVNGRGNRFTEQSIRIMLKKYKNSAGIEKNITPHMFRHSFATFLIEEGVDISCVQQILGHSSIKTTQIYIHVAAKRQADILRSLHPRNLMNIRAVA